MRGVFVAVASAVFGLGSLVFAHDTRPFSLACVNARLAIYSQRPVEDFPVELDETNSHHFGLKLFQGSSKIPKFNRGQPFLFRKFFEGKKFPDVSAWEELAIAALTVSKNGEELISLGDGSTLIALRLKGRDSLEIFPKHFTPSAADLISVKLRANGKHGIRIREFKSGGTGGAVFKAIQQLSDTARYLRQYHPFAPIEFVEVGLRSSHKSKIRDAADGYGYASSLQHQTGAYRLTLNQELINIEIANQQIPVYVNFYEELERVREPSQERSTKILVAH